MFVKDVDRDTLMLLGARASRVENQDAIDACIVGMLGDPKEVCYSRDISVSFHFFKNLNVQVEILLLDPKQNAILKRLCTYFM